MRARDLFFALWVPDLFMKRVEVEGDWSLMDPNECPGLSDCHSEAFEKIDCLTCAACCKNYSPRFKTPDIKRIARHLNLKEGEFIEKYLLLDEEGDYVVKSKPCPFLGNDNYCSIYSVRPKACAGYPHTDRKHFVQILDLTLKNTFVCPAAFEVVEKLKGKYGK